MYTSPFEITTEILRLVSEISELLGVLTATLEDNVPSPMLRKANNDYQSKSERVLQIKMVIGKL